MSDWHKWLGVVKTFFLNSKVSKKSTELKGLVGLKSDRLNVQNNLPCGEDPSVSKCVVTSSEPQNTYLPKNSQNLSKEGAVNPLCIKKDFDDRPYLSVNILSRNFLALIDSGSCASILGSDGLYILKSLDLSLSNDLSIHITTADGQPQHVLGYVWVPVTLNNITRPIKILVIPSLQHSLILGIDFLKEFGIEVNFQKLSYKTNFNSICVVNKLQPVSSLSPEQNLQLSEVTKLFKSIGPSDKLGLTNLLKHTIDTGNNKPFKQRQYPLPYAMQKCLNEEIDKMLKLGIIESSNSPWNSPIWLVKKSNGSMRICLDARKLNQVNTPSSWPMPLIDSIITKVRDAKYLSSIDLKQAFHQIPLDESSKPKTAFAVHGRGLFQYRVLPFGLNDSAQTMCKLMDMVIGPALEPYVFYYLDDIIVCTPDFQTHCEILKNLFDRLKGANLTINFEKCQFCRPSLRFLGYVVDEHGLRTDPDKISALLDYPVPKNTTQIRRLIGMVGYYRRFLKDFSSLCSPITDLLKGRKKGQPIVWNPEAEEAFKKIKTTLTTTPVLASPDFTKPFSIMCDASDTGVGCVLYQEEDGLEHPIAYGSRTLNKCQRKYTTTEKELLAVLFGIEKFRYYLEGTHFTVHTDHSSLIWLNSMKNPSPRIARWIVKLSQHSFKIVHRKGSCNTVADALSRSLENVSVLNLTSLKLDKWYINMMKNVQESPEKYPSFKVENNVLYKHVFSKFDLDDTVSNWKIVVPSAHRRETVKMYHDQETSGHLGLSKTLSRISNLYYWVNMSKDVYRHIKKCVICAASKASNLPQAGLMGEYRDINFPFQMISADLIGPYPRSVNGNQYLLVVVDWFTKFVLVQPMAKATTRAIVKFIENQVFLIYGVCQVFCCDNGSQFISKDFKNLMSKYNVQKIFYNAKYHAQINHTERVNRTIITAIRSYIHENHKTWDQSIYQVAQAIRLASHDVTGLSPSFLTFGRTIPVDGSFFGIIKENSENKIHISEKIHNPKTLQELPNIFENVRKKLRISYEKSKKRYDLRKRDVRFHVGDYVWKKNYVLSKAADHFAAKLAPKFIPCVITKVCSNLVYGIKDRDGNDLGKWHVSDLKRDVTEDLDSDDSIDSAGTESDSPD